MITISIDLVQKTKAYAAQMELITSTSSFTLKSLSNTLIHFEK